jgi:hypothetical protein
MVRKRSQVAEYIVGARPMTPSASSSAISDVDKPSSASSSWLCCPSSGAGCV